MDPQKPEQWPWPPDKHGAEERFPEHCMPKIIDGPADSSSTPHSDWAPSLENCRPKLPPFSKYQAFSTDTQEDWELHGRIARGEWPMYRSMREIDGEKDAWLICNHLVLRRSEGCLNNASWYDEKDNSSYFITPAPTPPPAATYREISTSRYRHNNEIQLVEALLPPLGLLGGWAIGYAAVLKVYYLNVRQEFTYENVTLDWVQNRLPSSKYKIPKSIYTTHAMGRSIQFQTQLIGPTLADVWLHISPPKKVGIITAVANFAGELAKIRGDKIGSVEGKGVNDWKLPMAIGPGYDWANPEAVTNQWANSPLRSGLRDIVFSHNWLCPANIIMVDNENEEGSPPTIGIIGWRRAGFVPKVHVRNSPMVDTCLNLPHRNRFTGEGTGITFDSEYRMELYVTMGRDPNNLPEMVNQYWAAHPERAAGEGPLATVQHRNYIDR